MKKAIAVIGNGFVGGSLSTVFFERGFDVYAFDKGGKYAQGVIPACVVSTSPTVQPSQFEPDIAANGSIAKLVEKARKNQYFTNVFFLCLPTPMSTGGEADLSIVEGVLTELSKERGEKIAVIKSTVPPGSVSKWNKKFKDTGLTITHSPEFLREATAIDDMRNQDRIIVGGPIEAVQIVKEVFAAAFPDVPFVATTSCNSELTKYVINCFLAMKVSFANEIFQLVEALQDRDHDVNYAEIIKCVTLDKRIGSSHFQVPSFEKDENGNPLRGFSLSCFPKDVNALIHKAKEVGVLPTMLEATWEKNLEVRPGKDWEKMFGRAVSLKKE